MHYLSGYWGLNVPSSLDVTGDWHQLCLNWNNVNKYLKESEDSIYKGYGIEERYIPFNEEKKYFVANPIRVGLDWLEEGNYKNFLGMREDYIGNENYTEEILTQISKLKYKENWKEIDQTVNKEYKYAWVKYKKAHNLKVEVEEVKGKYSLEEEQVHKGVMYSVLKYINKKAQNQYILKGGTALLFFYDLDRFSENLDLDTVDGDLTNILQDWCKEQKGEMTVHTIKYTNTTRRWTVQYNEKHTLKIEVSLRQRRRKIPRNQYLSIDGISVYTINSILKGKLKAYRSRDYIRDLYDISYIVSHYYDFLNEDLELDTYEALNRKGLEQFDYLVSTVNDPLINISNLEQNWLVSLQLLGLL